MAASHAYMLSTPIQLMEFAAHLYVECQGDNIAESWEDLPERWTLMREKMDKFVEEAFRE